MNSIVHHLIDIAVAVIGLFWVWRSSYWKRKFWKQNDAILRERQNNRMCG